MPQDRFTLYELLAGRRGSPHPQLEHVVLEKELNLVILGVLELFKEIYQSKHHAVKEAWCHFHRLTLLPIGPESIAVKRAAILVCLFQERDVQLHFKEMANGIDAAFVEDLITRVLPLLIPRYISTSFMRPAALVLLTLMMSEMWTAQQLGTFPHPRRTRPEYEALKKQVMARELQAAKDRQLGHARLRHLGDADADRVAQPTSFYNNTSVIASALEAASENDDDDDDDDGAGLGLIIAKGQIANNVHVRAWNRKDRTRRVVVDA
jgi:hypothetical protein